MNNVWESSTTTVYSYNSVCHREHLIFISKQIERGYPVPVILLLVVFKLLPFLLFQYINIQPNTSKSYTCFCFGLIFSKTVLNIFTNMIYDARLLFPRFHISICKRLRNVKRQYNLVSGGL